MDNFSADNNNYYVANDQEDTKRLIMSVIVVMVIVVMVVLNLDFSPRENQSTHNEYFRTSIPPPPAHRVWSGQGKDEDSVVTPVKRKTVPENDAPLSNTVTSRYVETDFGKSY